MTSLASHFLHARAAWPMLQRSEAAVIVAGGGEPGSIGEVSYAAAKSGVLGLTKALVAEGASSRIRVNAVLPGLIWNERLTAGVAEDYVDSYGPKRLFDRDGTPTRSLMSSLSSSPTRHATLPAKRSRSEPDLSVA
jgi:3-oxoacyl-[acyl-carrier protein] reductase